MPIWLRRTLYLLAALLLLTGALALWLIRGFDGARVQRAAIDWMRTHHDRELAFDGPMRPQLWPQPAVTVQRMRLSERAQPGQAFASIDSASLSLRLRPLLSQREIQVESVAARGLSLRLQRDADGRRNVDDLLDRVAGGEPRSGSSQAPTLDSLKLADVAVDVDDAYAGIRGRLVVARYELGASAPARCRRCTFRRKPSSASRR